MTNENDVGTFDQHQPSHITRRPNSRPTERPENRRLFISELVSAILTVDPREVICAYSFDEVSKHSESVITRRSSPSNESDTRHRRASDARNAPGTQRRSRRALTRPIGACAGVEHHDGACFEVRHDRRKVHEEQIGDLACASLAFTTEQHDRG